MDRYSDLLYLGAAALSIIGSIFAGIYTKVTRVAPEKASELATAILDIGERIEHAEFAGGARGAAGRTRGNPSRRGGRLARRHHLDRRAGTFKLGYEFVRDEIGMRRDHLKRHAGHEDNVVIVKTAQSA